MKKKLIVLLVACSTIFGFAQEVKLKKGEILIDATPWMKYQDCGTFDSTCSIVNSQNEEVVFIKDVKLRGAEPITNNNQSGDVTYQEIIFVGQKMKIELKEMQKSIIRIIYNSKAINADGTLNPEKVDRLVEKYGTPFSDRFNRSTNNNPGTIIINNNQTPQRSGVNINLGR